MTTCPACNREWPDTSEQAACIRLYRRCTVCCIEAEKAERFDWSAERVVEAANLAKAREATCPSREDIVEWIREASVLAKQVSRYQHAIGAVRSSDETGFIIRKFEKRAAQVEAMRCESCTMWDCPARVDGHGCFSHEQKEPAD